MTPVPRSFFLLALMLLAALTSRAQVYEGKTLVNPSLVADVTAVVPGQPFEVGVLLDMAPGWHTYWEYSGDSGLPNSLAWTLPSEFSAGAIQWPLPLRLVEPGDIEVYAYKGKVLLITTITPPAQITEKTLTLKVKAQWLVCEEVCIPGQADLELTLPVAVEAQPANTELFNTFRKQLTSTAAPPYGLKWSSDGKTISLALAGLGNATAVDLYPLPTEQQEVGHAQNGPISNGDATISIAATGTLRGALVVEGPAGRQSWFVSSAQGTAAVEPTPASSTVTLWLALLYGFLGGLILNLMPCVLPVISLKIFGFVRQAGNDPKKILGHGLAFVAGIFAWFLSLGLLIVILKLSGREVTWAFQFQNPWFNVAIGCLVFVFALNLFGVFEIILPGRASRALDEASGQEGYAGSFFQGVFATLLATPCTAPFLGLALGYAFTQSPALILVMFAAVALGMSAPYFLLSARPGWMKILPKPGVWMERVKQFMGFPLLATLLWLLYVLGNQKGLEAVMWMLAFLLCLAMACWLYGAFCGPISSPRTRAVSLLCIVLIIAWGGWYFLGQKFADTRREESTKTEHGGIAWQSFSQKTLDGLLAEGRPVFVDFTADWCISCKFNERTAIDTPAVREAIAKKGIVPIKADWTNANPEITAALKKFGRVGVPFYLFYPKGQSTQPVILPEILTQAIVLDAFEKTGP